MTRSIAFHSYKGGTGKSTIGANLSALMARRGLTVVLLDLDIYAPSLQGYFHQSPEKWINDFLFENAQVEDVIHDLTPLIEKIESTNSFSDIKGKIFVGFSNPSKEEIYRLDGAVRQESSKIQLLRKFILLRENIVSTYNPDFIIIDTSPGIRYWSINALAVADTIFLSLKMDGIDVEGTRIMAREIYDNFTKLGTKSYLLLNRVAGYCLPPLNQEGVASGSQNYSAVLNEQSMSIKKLNTDLNLDVISSIPCYCDIQFNSEEYLTALKNPDHPFSAKLNELVDNLQSMIQ
jgi:MinD-like ATPase involved in chromosome partitioning or flagellar assembly